jgi:hypothetical protein
MGNLAIYQEIVRVQAELVVAARRNAELKQQCAVMRKSLACAHFARKPQGSKQWLGTVIKIKRLRRLAGLKQERGELIEF